MIVRGSIGVSLVLAVAATIWGQNARTQEPPRANIAMQDQFERNQDVANLKGDVVIVLYGDKSGTPGNRTLGEKLHVHYHPTAKGMTAQQAQKAPASRLEGLPDGVRNPDVRVVAVACCGKVPDVVKGLIRSGIAKEAPEVPVWLDFEDKMKTQYGMKEGETNLLIIDAQGRVRLRMTGDLDANAYARVLQVSDFLRKEAAGVR